MYNEFSHRIEKVKNSHGKKKGLEWSDSDTVLLRAFLDETKKFKVDKNTIMASLLQSANARHHHPVKAFIEAEKWDGIKRIERIFIDYLGVEDTEYSREVTKNGLLVRWHVFIAPV